MNYKFLGKTGVKVSALCFGTMSFGADADERATAEGLLVFARRDRDALRVVLAAAAMILSALVISTPIFAQEAPPAQAPATQAQPSQTTPPQDKTTQGSTDPAGYSDIVVTAPRMGVPYSESPGATSVVSGPRV